ncbi:restriction endonuclease subunit S [Chryseobacterium sp. MEBOG06]|uniref:restriction endonuclease subunit S n=1 Tax=Chryseobacterium sp. MEBOG06 TaxID=2879938 RepID=UPI001EFFEFEC|nr:restriction endonuclease subunit S [Chryseobacterium sp. MEBOG06]UKB82609.1 restriction endonuclease subunit S [Chryseobacterium sp. MEBOG06]
MSNNIRFVKFSTLYNWDVKQFVESSSIYTDNLKIVPFKQFARPASLNRIHIQDDEDYKILGVRSYGFGAYVNRKVKGKSLKMKVYQQVKSNHLYWCKVDTKNGAFGIITEEISDGVASSNMTLAELDLSVINPDFLQIFFKSKKFNEYMDSFVTGTTNRKYIRPSQIFEDIKIPLPPLNDEDAKIKSISNEITQKKLVDSYFKKIEEAEIAKINAQDTEKKIEEYLFEELGINEINHRDSNYGLSFIRFKNLTKWSVNDISKKALLNSSIYPNKKLKDVVEINPTTSFLKFDTETETAFIPMVNISDIEGKVIKYNKGYVGKSKGYTKFIDGDLLWARITPCMENGKSAIVNNMPNNIGYGSTEYHIIRSNDETFLEYIHFLLRLNLVLQDAKLHFTGSAGQQRVPKSYLENLEIPIPPSNIQETIVKTIIKLKEDIKSYRSLESSLRKDALWDFEKKIFKN